MKKNVNLFAVMMFLIALAMFIAKVKTGGGYGFSSGG